MKLLPKLKPLFGGVPSVFVVDGGGFTPPKSSPPLAVVDVPVPEDATTGVIVVPPNVNPENNPPTFAGSPDAVVLLLLPKRPPSPKVEPPPLDPNKPVDVAGTLVVEVTFVCDPSAAAAAVGSTFCNKLVNAGSGAFAVVLDSTAGPNEGGSGLSLPVSSSTTATGGMFSFVTDVCFGLPKFSGASKAPPVEPLPKDSVEGVDAADGSKENVGFETEPKERLGV